MNPNAQTWSNLSAFKRDAIIAVLRRGGHSDSDKEKRPHGLAIKRELDLIRGEDVHHGRLYPNLDDLVDANLLRKGERDERTNTYHVTDQAVEAFAAYMSQYVGFEVEPIVVGVLARRKYDAQTSKGPGD